MAAASVSIRSSFEVLTGDNYERWSVLMRNYLKGEGLWDNIISGDINQRGKGWQRRNAKALYAIQLSCGPGYFEWISEMEHARDAWNRLKSLRGPNLGDISLDADIDDYPLHRHAESGDWNKMKKAIMENRNVIFERNASRKTALHVAVIAGHEHVVERLVNILRREDERLLTKQDRDGYTALALVAQLNGNMRMARCMVEKNRDLLTIKTNDDQTPLFLASARVTNS